ncbi:MAG: class I SAM-dependent methyltransferase [Candidatus Marinimicrobia bacterium]|nr:class I SAM-dependent methyltransferase [Candidatus Neomarinimicrobiota bacterium]
MTDWYKFWQKYRVIEINSEDDLLFQVGRTINKKPESIKELNLNIQDIKEKLSLNEKDILLDLCCGNGIVTFALSKYVDKVIGVDFSNPLIINAKKYNSNKNIQYIEADIIDTKIYEFDYNYNKVLISASLQYLTVNDFDKLLYNLTANLRNKLENIFITDIMDVNRKWNFFRTFKQKLDYFIKIKVLGKSLGLGKWWSRKEIITLADKYNFSYKFFSQNKKINTSHYRFNVLLNNKLR